MNLSSRIISFILMVPLLIYAQRIDPLFPTSMVQRTGQDKKISPLVFNLVHEMHSKSFTQKNLPSIEYLLKRTTRMVQIDQSARIQVTITDNISTSAAADLIHHLNGTIVTQNDRWHKIVAWMPYQNITALAESENIRNIKETERGHKRTGLINSEGDTLHNTILVRDLIGADGSGKTVGVISDGCDNLASSQLSGDLPGTVNVIDNSAGGDEGTAMLEIVHDLAPGAGLAFSEGIQNSLEFINSISDLVAAGCDVIVDDIGYFTEPWFEEGPIATAAREAIENDGVVYASSAGNSQDEHYEGDFSGLGPRLGLNDVHNFGGGDWGQSFTVGPGVTIYIFLQWNDPFGSSTNDYVIHLASADTSSLLGISSFQPDSDNPYALLGAVNNGMNSASATIVIERVSGSANRRVEMEYNATGSFSINEHNILPGSINGQPAVNAVIATGAVRFNTPNLIEYFSSIGPSRIYSYPSYAFEERMKPDLVAVNGNQITGAGGFGQEWPSGSGNIRFFGTSASAPHAAAGAAVVWSAYPNLTNSEVKQRLLNSAIDLGSAGFDYMYGYGRMDVQQACDSPPFTVSGVNGGSDALLSNAVSPGDAFAEMTGYIFTANVAPFQVYLDKIQFTLSGSSDENDFNGFSLYVDRNEDRQITPVTDSLLATGVYANPLIFDSLGYVFDNTGHRIILSADISATANPNHVLNIQLNENSDILAYFDVAAYPDNFPFTPADISLPVQLMSFKHEIETRGVRLIWETASELNSLFFEIERHIRDSKKVITRIEAAGNTSAYQQYEFLDNTIIMGEEMVYSLFLIENNGRRVPLAETALTVSLPPQVALLPNYPNPFNAQTLIQFSLPVSAEVLLEIFNISGQNITTLISEYRTEGIHSIEFDATDFSSGIYYAYLKVKTINGSRFIRSQQMILIK